MITLRRLGFIATLAIPGALVGCAPSGYSFDFRNNTGSVVQVDIKSKKDNQDATRIAGTTLTPGSNQTLFTQADRDAKVTVEATIQGDTQSPPAIQKVILGLTKLQFNPNPDAAKDEKKPKLRIREDR